MKPADINAMFRTFESLEPEPKTELEFTNPYTLLVAVILSAQATDAGVNKATPALFAAADTPQKMVRLGLEGITRYIRTIGLFNAKAKNILAMSGMLVKEYGGQVPQSRELLETLPGVGRKTANVWLNCVKGEPTMAVDTHVFRVANRTGLACAKTPLAVERKLEKVIPSRYMRHAHHWLILHGRYCCKARTPECWRCPVASWCQYREKNLTPPKAR